MSAETDQLELIRAQALAQLVELTEDPEPSYTLNGQSVTWVEYFASLEQTIDWCDRKLAECRPFEVRSAGTT